MNCLKTAVTDPGQKDILAVASEEYTPDAFRRHDDPRTTIWEYSSAMHNWRILRDNAERENKQRLENNAPYATFLEDLVTCSPKYPHLLQEFGQTMHQRS